MTPRQAQRIALAGIAFVHVALGLVLLTPAWIRPDSVMEYAFVRSALLDRDFLFFNEWAHFGMIRDGVTMTKEVNAHSILVNHGWVGTSLLVAPQYALSLLFSRPDGFSGLQGAVFAWSTVAFAIGVSIVIFLMLERVAPALSVAMRLIVTAAVAVGTPMLWYEYRFPLGTHLAGAVCIALLTWWLVRLLDGEDASAFIIGVLLGLAIVTRLQHVVLAPAVGLALLSARRPLIAFRDAITGSLLPGAAQAIVWWILYGHPLGPIVSGANASGSTWSPFRDVAVLPVLFSSYHGLFTWAPLSLLAIAGLVLAVRGPHARIAMVLLLMFAGELVANSAFDRFWWAGMSFGPRRFVDLAVVFGVGLGWLLVAARPYVARVASLAAICLASAWTALLALAAMGGQLNLSHDVTPEELVRNALSPLNGAALQLRSAVTDASFLLESVAAIAIIGVVMAAIVTIARTRAGVYAAAAFLLVCCAASAALWTPTRSRAAAEAARFRIDPVRAAREGPLIDQRNLLGAMRDYYADRGMMERAHATQLEIASIEQTLNALRKGVR